MRKRNTPRKEFEDKIFAWSQVTDPNKLYRWPQKTPVLAGIVRTASSSWWGRA